MAYEESAIPVAGGFDLNPGGGLTRFGEFDYGEAKDMFATLVRVRNRYLHGWWDNPATSPYDDSTLAYWDSTAYNVGAIEVYDNCQVTLGELPAVDVTVSDIPAMSRLIDGIPVSLGPPFFAEPYITGLTGEEIRNLFHRVYRPVESQTTGGIQRKIAPLTVKVIGDDATLRLDLRDTVTNGIHYEPTVYIRSPYFSFGYWLTSDHASLNPETYFSVGDVIEVEILVGSSNLVRGPIVSIVRGAEQNLPGGGTDYVGVITCQLAGSDPWGLTPADIGYGQFPNWWKASATGTVFGGGYFGLRPEANYSIYDDNPFVGISREGLSGEFALETFLPDDTSIPTEILYKGDTTDNTAITALQKLLLTRVGSPTITANDT